MQKGKFSRTAYGVALRRAAHQLFDEVRVFDDPLAVRIIGEAGAARLAARTEETDSRASRTLRAFVAARSRYAEDQLAEAVAGGTCQYVLLGAGLDTFAYRNSHPSVRVFEVDHPATQQLKGARLREAGIAVPSRLTFVPVDFEQQTLSEGMEHSGFDLYRPAFFSWLGVTPYLTRKACMETLAFIAQRPKGSGVVFDFAVDRGLLGPLQKIALDVLSARVAKAGEPFQLFFVPKQLSAELASLGFQRIEMLDGEAINQRYFHGRSDGLQVGSLGQIVSASV